jgi:hypothetical protein
MTVSSITVFVEISNWREWICHTKEENSSLCSKTESKCAWIETYLVVFSLVAYGWGISRPSINIICFLATEAGM